MKGRTHHGSKESGRSLCTKLPNNPNYGIIPPNCTVGLASMFQQIFKTSCCKLKECCCQLKHQKCARALKEGGVGTRSFIFLSEKLLYFFLGLCYYSDKFPKMFCSLCGIECPSTVNFCHQCGQQLNLSQVSNKAASSVDKEKLLKRYVFPSETSLRSIDYAH